MVQMMTTGLYRFCEWVTRLAFLNILWLFFSVAGLGVFSFFPATAAMFSVARKWAMGESDVPVFKTFWAAFRKEWRQANKLGYLLAVPGVLLTINFLIFEQYGSPLPFLPLMMMSLSLCYGVIALFVFPVYVHYNVTVRQTIKYALLIGFIRPLHTVMLLASCIGLVYVMMQHITFLLFFSGSAFCFVFMKLSMTIFHNMAQKQSAAATELT